MKYSIEWFYALVSGKLVNPSLKTPLQNRQNEKEVPGCSISQMNRSKHYNRQNMTCLLVI